MSQQSKFSVPRITTEQMAQINERTRPLVEQVRQATKAMARAASQARTSWPNVRPEA